jgi:hypothetical protein
MGEGGYKSVDSIWEPVNLRSKGHDYPYALGRLHIIKHFAEANLKFEPDQPIPW